MMYEARTSAPSATAAHSAYTSNRLVSSGVETAGGRGTATGAGRGALRAAGVPAGSSSSTSMVTQRSLRVGLVRARIDGARTSLSGGLEHEHRRAPVLLRNDVDEAL